MPNAHPPSWSLEAGRELLPGLVSPFTWSVMGCSAERALHRVFEELGQPLPAGQTLWRWELGRAYANSQAMVEATEAVFASASAGPSLGQQLLGRGQERRQAAVLHGTIEQVLNSDDTKKNLDLQGASPLHMSAGEFGGFIKSEMTKWGPVVTKAGIKAE